MSDHSENAVIDTKTAAAAHHTTPPPAPADDENPAIIDARKTFVLTLISSILFVGAIMAFVL